MKTEMKNIEEHFNNDKFIEIDVSTDESINMGKENKCAVSILLSFLYNGIANWYREINNQTLQTFGVVLSLFFVFLIIHKIISVQFYSNYY